MTGSPAWDALKKPTLAGHHGADASRCERCGVRGERVGAGRDGTTRRVESQAPPRDGQGRAQATCASSLRRTRHAHARQRGAGRR
jgi:hypothetical protein